MSVLEPGHRANAAPPTRATGDHIDWAAVQQVHASGATSLLAAHRTARGWTLEETARRAAALASLDSGAITAQMLCSWERGRVIPSLAKVDLLCRLYRTRPDRLGLLTDYSDEPGDTPAELPEPVRSATADPLADLVLVQRFTARPGTAIPAPVLNAMQGIRLHVDDALERAEATPADLDPWRSAASGYIRQYFGAPSPVLLPKLFADVVALQKLLVQGRSSRYCQDVYHIQAQLGGLIGTNLISLGAAAEAKAWYRTARAMAVAARDRHLEAWIVAHRGFLAQYEQKPRKSLWYAREAQALSAGMLWALSVEAKALLQLGRQREAELVQRRVSEHWARRPDGADDADLYGFDEVYLRWNEGSVYTRGSEPMRGWERLGEAIALTPATSQTTRRFRSMQRAEQALALLNDGRIADACDTAQAIIAEVPPGQRPDVIAMYLDEVAATVAPRYQHLTCVRELRDALNTLRATA